MAGKSKTKSGNKKARSVPPDMSAFNIPNLDMLDDENDDDSDVDESALESELEALLSGKMPAKKPSKPKKPVMAPADIEKLAAECLKDSEDDDDDENLSADEELMAELNELTPAAVPIEYESVQSKSQSRDRSIEATSPEKSGSIISVLEERIKLYEEAIRAANATSDTSKSRRYGRALKTLESLLKSARSGAIVPEDDIPPIVKVPNAKESASQDEKTLHVHKNDSEVPTVDSDLQHDDPSSKAKEIRLEVPSSHCNIVSEIPLDELLIARRNEYRTAALQAKKAGDTENALKYVKVAKTFDTVIEAAKNGQQVDLSSMPPSIHYSGVMPDRKTEDKGNIVAEMQTSSIEEAALNAASGPEDPTIFDAPPPPTTILEALEQRLNKYVKTRDAAQAEGNGSKVRRLQRLIKLYETAIKDYKAGKSVDFDELPTPPGFGPIPVETSNRKPANKPVTALPDSNLKPVQRKPATSSCEASTSERKPAQQAKTSSVQRVKATPSMATKQLEFLLNRQKMFREAALDSKRNGDFEQAKEYLRMSKGFNSMIEATKCGLPIDATTIPTPPQLLSDFVVVDVSDCVEMKDGDPGSLYESLEKDLLHQIDICMKNKEHFSRLGDVSAVSKFEKLCSESKKDLNVIRHLKSQDKPVPTFRYESRMFSFIQCFSDLGDNDLEVSIERGIDLPGKANELDSYVRMEFPIPPEAPQRGKTQTVDNTNNPAFHTVNKFEINRKSRSHLRHFKRQALKLEVYSKGGFLRSDKLLGMVLVKLADLETKCLIHDSFPLIDNRKACGGKLEVKIRIKEPLVKRQIEEVKEKWLVFDTSG